MLQGPKKRSETTPATARVIGQAISLVLLAASVLAALVLIVVPFATGSQTYTVLTSSMAPHYPPGTFIVVRPTEFSSLEAGDVVTYQIESGKPAVITHRITGFSSDQEGNRLLVTKGDNNDATDAGPVQEIQVRGRLFYAVPYAGFLANALGQTNRSMAVNLLAAALICYGLFLAGRGVVGRKQTAVEA